MEEKKKKINISHVFISHWKKHTARLKTNHFTTTFLIVCFQCQPEQSRLASDHYLHCTISKSQVSHIEHGENVHKMSSHQIYHYHLRLMLI